MGLTGCEDEETVEYSDDIGIVSGNIEFNDDEEPSITLSNIKSYVGAEVDYLSRIIVSDPDKYDEMEIWVDASLVDIFTTGDYKAVYTFIFEGKEYIRDIVVTIIEKPEASGDEYDSSTGGDIDNTSDNEDNTSDETTSKDNGTTKDEETSWNEVTTKDKETSKDDATTKNNATSKEDETTKENVTTKNNVTTRPTTTKKNPATVDSTTTKNNGTTTSAEKNTTTSAEKNTTTVSKETTTRKQLITSSGKITTKFQELGFYSIELLSGKVIKIKCTTSKFIVSTHTDISYITKNGNRYKVSKLVVTYSTGDTQVLETVEEKVK